MMDLNALIPAHSTLMLMDAFFINTNGEVVGDAVEKSTGQIHAYSAVPCYEACNWLPESSMGSDTNKIPTFDVPENVRKLLEQRWAKWPPYRGFGLSAPQK
jgi:hypothetical protein